MSDTPGPPIQCCVGAVVCAVKEIEKSTLFWGEGGKCDQDAQKFTLLSPIVAGLLTSFMLEILAYNALVTYIAFQDYNMNGDIDRFYDLTNRYSNLIIIVPSLMKSPSQVNLTAVGRKPHL